MDEVMHIKNTPRDIPVYARMCKNQDAYELYVTHPARMDNWRSMARLERTMSCTQGKRCTTWATVPLPTAAEHTYLLRSLSTSLAVKPRSVHPSSTNLLCDCSSAGFNVCLSVCTTYSRSVDLLFVIFSLFSLVARCKKKWKIEKEREEKHISISLNEAYFTSHVYVMPLE